MAQEQKKPADECNGAKDLLKQINQEIATFEAKKLADLKKDLEQFVGKQSALVDEYKQKFPGFRKTWCELQVEVDRLCSGLSCEFPPDKLKALISKCICKPVHDLCCLGHNIHERDKCLVPPIEQKVHAAQWVYDEANRKLQALTVLTGTVDADLKKEKALIDQIHKAQGADRPAVIYLFGFKLLPLHKHLKPPGVECKDCQGWDVNVLCKDENESGCTDTPGCGCEKPAPTATAYGEKPPKPCSQIGEDGSILIDPDTYCKELDDAWLKVSEAKNKLADAQAELKKCKDELAAMKAKRTATTEPVFDEAVKACLKSSWKNEDCCKETETTRKAGY